MIRRLSMAPYRLARLRRLGVRAVRIPAIFLFGGGVLAACAPAGAAGGKQDSAPAHNFRMGVCAHFGNGADYKPVLPLLDASGVGWVRDDLYWNAIEKSPGKYEISARTREWIEAVHAHGFKLNLILNGNNPIYKDRYDPEAYARFAAATARLLKGRVDSFEILNEPYNFGFVKANGGGAWNGYEADGSVSPWVGKYVALLNKASAAIKAVDPSIKVIGLGSVTPVNFRQLSIGLAPTVDGIADHPYSFRSVPEILPFNSSPEMVKRDGIACLDEKGTFTSMIENYRAASLKNHGPKEIWLTEFGYTTSQPIKPTLYAGVTPSAQAKYLQRRFVQAIALGVNVTFAYDFVDDGVDPHEVEHHFGLLDASRKPKPAYDAVRRVAAALQDLSPRTFFDRIDVHPYADRPDAYPIVWDGSKMAAPGDVAVYSFADAKGRPAIAVWSTERADGDLSPRIADLTFTGGPAFTKIRAEDLLTGETQDIALQRDAEGKTRVSQITIPDHPLLLRLE